MPKTRNAFALKNFDEERILQRRYFNDCGKKPNFTDSEIVQSLMVNDSDSIDEMEEKLSKIKALHTRLLQFNALIKRHIQRKGKACIEEITAQMSISELETKLRETYYSTEKTIQSKYRKIFTERLKQYRKAAGLTQKELGELVQVSPMGMSYYARGEREMPLHTLARISKILDISADELLGIK